MNGRRYGSSQIGSDSKMDKIVHVQSINPSIIFQVLSTQILIVMQYWCSRSLKLFRVCTDLMIRTVTSTIDVVVVGRRLVVEVVESTKFPMCDCGVPPQKLSEVWSCDCGHGGRRQKRPHRISKLRTIIASCGGT